MLRYTNNDHDLLLTETNLHTKHMTHRRKEKKD
jgi:hypothetical protein